MRVVMLVVALLTSTFALADVEQTLVNNIEQAKKRLASTERSISRERAAMAKELQSLEETVLKLRNETAVARRKMDERTLSLSQLEERLAQWQEQQDFQQNLTDRFLQQQGASYSDLQSTPLAQKIAQVRDAANVMRGEQTPSWRTHEVVLQSGELVNADVLTVGPVTWFINGSNEEAGLASWQNNMLKAQSMLDSSAYDALTALKTQGQAPLTLDPTLGRASTKENASESVLEHVIKGGIWVVPILLFALIATLIGIAKIVQLVRLPKVQAVGSNTALQSLVAQQGKGAFAGMQQQLYSVADNAHNERDRDDELFSLLQQQKHSLDKWNNSVAVTAAVAPLLGLLGTVSGMIETFKMMTAFGSSDPEVVSGGIAKALVTTELGLVVAIPALILHALLSRKSRAYYEQLESFAIVLSNQEAKKASNDDNAQEPHQSDKARA